MRPQVFVGTADSTPLVVIAFWTVFYVWFLTELLLGWRLTRRKSSAAVDDDANSKWILIGSIWSGVAFGIGLALLVPSAALTQHRRELLVIGLAFALLGMGLRWYSIWFLGQSFTCEVATRPGQTVVDGGPYRLVRHPSYTGGLLTVLGLMLCQTNPIAFTGFLLTLVGYAYRIRVEERVLARELGDSYRQYMRRTRRLIPYLL